MFLGYNDFSLHIEELKRDKHFDTYLETITWYIENETDVDYDKVAKNLNQKILDNIKIEAMKGNMLKEKEVVITLYDL